MRLYVCNGVVETDARLISIPAFMSRVALRPDLCHTHFHE